eukprot:scaffold126700_cov21-Tisochrysis_lutea.AAC.1
MCKTLPPYRTHAGVIHVVRTVLTALRVNRHNMKARLQKQTGVQRCPRARAGSYLDGLDGVIDSQGTVQHHQEQEHDVSHQAVHLARGRSKQ